MRRCSNGPRIVRKSRENGKLVFGAWVIFGDGPDGDYSEGHMTFEFDEGDDLKFQNPKFSTRIVSSQSSIEGFVPARN